MPKEIYVISAYADGKQRREEKAKHPYHELCTGGKNDAITLQALGLESNRSKPGMYISSEQWERLFGNAKENGEGTQSGSKEEWVDGGKSG
uniref:Uncharacterized protein n=1 Tax=viral metagenome TaxID=1070528 RepID=A0A6M3JXA2_9ZZZZ